ncbi:MAG TPA: hypothetical protein VMH87_07815 [Pseudomonadales bacterium]|nr:hypothetical protein [Pseudomonadales bacterium]
MTSPISNTGPLRKSPSATTTVGRKGLCLEPKPVLPSGGYVAWPSRVRMVSVSTVRAIRGVDAERVTAMVDNALDAQHIRFAFNVALKPGRSARELRCWLIELAAPMLVAKITIEEAIAEILGARESWPREELGICWTISSQQIGRLIKGGCFNLERNRITRSSLETFLWTRWTGNNPT